MRAVEQKGDLGRTDGETEGRGGVERGADAVGQGGVAVAKGQNAVEQRDRLVERGVAAEAFDFFETHPVEQGGERGNRVGVQKIEVEGLGALAGFVHPSSEGEPESLGLDKDGGVGRQAVRHSSRGEGKAGSRPRKRLGQGAGLAGQFQGGAKDRRGHFDGRRGSGHPVSRVHEGVQRVAIGEHLGMVAAEGFGSEVNGRLEERLGGLRVAALEQKSPQVGKTRADVGVAVAQDLAADRQRLAQQGLGVGKAASTVKHPAEITEGRGGHRMSSAQGLSTDGQRLSQQGLGVGVSAPAVEQERQGRQAGGVVGVAVSQCVLAHFQGLAHQGFGRVEVSALLKEVGEMAEAGGVLRVEFAQSLPAERERLAEKRFRLGALSLFPQEQGQARLRGCQVGMAGAQPGALEINQSARNDRRLTVSTRLVEPDNVVGEFFGLDPSPSPFAAQAANRQGPEQSTDRQGPE